MVKSDDEYFRITHTYAIEGCKAMNEANPEKFTFCFLSGQGADSTEKSRFLFARVKGKTENDLQKLGKVYSFRPGLIDPTNSPSVQSLHQRILTPILLPVFRAFIPSMIVTPEELAKAMIKVARFDSEKLIFEQKDIKEAAATFDI